MRQLCVIVSLWLLVLLSLAQSQDQDRLAGVTRGRRQRTGHGRPREGHHSQALTRTGSLPLNHGEEGGASIFIESYRSVRDPQTNYNVIPGKQGQCVYQGITMFNKAVWSPKPCVTCLCTGGEVVCDEVSCPTMHCHFPFIPTGECCPVCMDAAPDLPDFSGDSPVPNDPSDPNPDPVGPHTQAEIDVILKREQEEHRAEEERLLKKDAERKRRRKKLKKEEAEKQRRLEEERRKEEDELRATLAKEEERRQAEEERRLEEEDRRLREEAEAAAKEKERQVEEERIRHKLNLMEKLRALEEEEEEEEVWLRGDVFQMPPKVAEESIQPIPAPPEEHHGDVEEEEEAQEEEIEMISPRAGLPPGCDISDVIVTCENAKLTSFPPLSIPELKSLSLEGNTITSIPVGAFNGIPNLEWINLGKNKLTSAGIAPKVFQSLKHLSRLYLDGNLLQQVPSDLPSTLQELKINENKLREIEQNSFQDLSHLLTLEMEDNVLSEGNVSPLAFAPLTQLSYLRMGRNHFRTIPQGLPPSLLELYLENNLIEEISDSVFNQTTNLNLISLGHNRLDESRIAPLAWINHKNLESIDLSHNRMYLVPSYLPRSLVHLVLVGNQIERIPGYVFAHMEPGIEYLYLSYNKLDGEGVEPESFFGAFGSMIELCLDHNQLTTVPTGINEMKSLHFLRLNSNNIRNFAEDAICDPLNEDDSHIVALRLENNYIDPRKVSPTAFSCVRSYSSVVLKPQKTK
ncbi:extracellular matrix protein 2 isoform X1 [Osmerus mordax]|uniref:extracellular matrix protein 2 isoform X1 n=1 Tax=Osmerus mordax TaxID=8014 RepID=UPI00351075B1